MKSRRNRRGYTGHFVENQHLKLDQLKKRALGLKNQYLFKCSIPAYPRPEFHVSHLKHDTDQVGLRGIRRDGGFKNPNDGSLQWWSLSVGPDEMESAEKKLLEQKYPDRTEEQVQKQQSFLWRFATSPAFEETSRMGSYRFTFPLQEVLNAYREQFCCGAPPVMRVFETVLYQQEVMYSVLVHSPANQEQFSEYPLLTDDPNAICTFKDGRFIWRSEAMCETHSYKLVFRDDDKQMEAREAWKPDQFHVWKHFYVWDHVTVALHVDKQVLRFDANRLRENLKFCNKGSPQINGSTFEDFEQAEELVKELWPDHHSPLEGALDKEPAGIQQEDDHIKY